MFPIQLAPWAIASLKYLGIGAVFAGALWIIQDWGYDRGVQSEQAKDLEALSKQIKDFTEAQARLDEQWREEMAESQRRNIALIQREQERSNELERFLGGLVESRLDRPLSEHYVCVRNAISTRRDPRAVCPEAYRQPRAGGD